MYNLLLVNKPKKLNYNIYNKALNARLIPFRPRDGLTILNFVMSLSFCWVITNYTTSSGLSLFYVMSHLEPLLLPCRSHKTS